MSPQGFLTLHQINWKGAAVLIGVIILLSLFSKIFAILLLLAGVVFVSIIVNHFGLRVIGLELATFATVISGVVYGPLIGTLVGLILVTIHLLLSGYFGVYYMWVIPGYGLAGYLASQWSAQNIIALGMTITILLHAINMFFSFFFRRQDIFRYLIYIATNVVFNFIVFTVFGSWVVAVLK